MFLQETASKVEDAFCGRFATLPYPAGLEETLESSTHDEALSLKFLYAFMPMSDVASYDPGLFYKIAKHALDRRSQNIFGEDYPDEVFLNFVLQCRINNENLEYNREYFLGQLQPRIACKTAEEAVIEINYWCLEKATYEGSNIRTMSPFTLLKSTLGRCGEESVFTVSALRSVGIPARQIYTPRWVHCESNHAWVEVYLGGRWRFLGACEPEPVLDKGWFTGPASKAMLIYARLFSTMPPKDEDVAYFSEIACEINRTGHYVKNSTRLEINVRPPSERVKIHVQVASANSLTNLVSLTPDASGHASVTLGRGHVHLHVTDGSRFVTRHVNLAETNLVDIDFSSAVESQEHTASFLMAPPESLLKDPEYSLGKDDMRMHEERVAKANQLRQEIVDGFLSKEAAEMKAQGFLPNNFGGSRFFADAKGNHGEIEKFMKADVGVATLYKYLLLSTLAKKDLLDLTSDILMDHLEHALLYKDNFYEDVFAKYILCPRIEIEMLTAYRRFIIGRFDVATADGFRSNPSSIWNWLVENITDTTAEYATSNDHRRLAASPVGLLTYGHGGIHSRKICFVAICRSLGIPARLCRADERPEYYFEGDFLKLLASETPVHSLSIKANGREIGYYSDYTIARLENSEYRTLGLGYGNIGTLHRLEEGFYRIITGKRLENESMAINLYHVRLDADKTVEVELPTPVAYTQTIKSIADVKINGTCLPEILTGRDIVAQVNPSHEPTEHLLRELMEAHDDLVCGGFRITLATKKSSPTLEKVKEMFGESVLMVGVGDDSFADSLAEQTDMGMAELPVMALVLDKVDAVYYVKGYHAGSVRRAYESAGRLETAAR